MRIAQHWRLNSQRYRLQGVRYADGRVSLCPRRAPAEMENLKVQPAAVQPVVKAGAA